MALEYDVIDQQGWEAVPAKQPKPPSEWEPILDDLESGKIVSIPLADERDRRGKRLALGRRAAGRGFKVEMRSTETHLLARRSDVPYSAPEPQSGGARRGRRKQTAAGAP